MGNKWGKELRLKAVKSSLRKTSKTLCLPPASSGLKSRPTPFSAIPFITEATKRRKKLSKIRIKHAEIGAVWLSYYDDETLIEIDFCVKNSYTAIDIL